MAINYLADINKVQKFHQRVGGYPKPKPPMQRQPAKKSGMLSWIGRAAGRFSRKK